MTERIQMDFKRIYRNETDFENSIDLIKELYPHIYKSMKDNDYSIEYPEFDVFQEINYKDEVVGFFTLEDIALATIRRSLNEVYIMPEYRGKGLFADLIINLILTPNLELLIENQILILYNSYLIVI